MNKTRILGFALAVTALFLIVLGFAKNGVVDEFNVYWMAAVCAAVPGVFLIAGKPEAATLFSRIIVGSVFLVSGLIKANDTVGFGIKLEEYFDENALGSFWAVFHDYSLAIAFFVSGIEVLLGLAVLFGAKARLVSIVLLGMTLFFGWLTYFTAECNDAQMAAITSGADFNRVCVTDCGCFGDALRGSVGRSLTPWESFYKDLGLFFLTLVILFRSGKIKVNNLRSNAIILPSAVIITLL
ncbi:MAG: DoxX family membrane protein, partial [Flavobacteriales bacterium]|nr:DoxX family membrane protein [Flavobacteriales bacterium]